MAISGDLKVLAGAFAPHPKQALRPALLPFSPSSSAALPASSKAKFGSIHGVRCNHLDAPNKFPKEIRDDHTRRRGHQCSASRKNSVFPAGADPETDGFILNAARMNFFERLSLAWRILFPTVAAAAGRSSNANIAKQRLKMILFSDRCAVSDEAKQKIVGSIVSALSDFVEIDSEDKVQLSVSTDPDLGTVYSVTVPVRRVKPEFRGGGSGEEEEYRGVTGIEFKDTGEESGTVDVRFDFFVPGEMGSESSFRF